MIIDIPDDFHDIDAYLSDHRRAEAATGRAEERAVYVTRRNRTKRSA